MLLTQQRRRTYAKISYYWPVLLSRLPVAVVFPVDRRLCRPIGALINDLRFPLQRREVALALHSVGTAVGDLIDWFTSGNGIDAHILQ